MIFWLDLVPDLANDTVFVDQERGAFYTHVLFTKEVFLSVDIIQLGDGDVSVSEQGERQLVLGRKFLVGVNIVGANA